MSNIIKEQSIISGMGGIRSPMLFKSAGAPFCSVAIMLTLLAQCLVLLQLTVIMPTAMAQTEPLNAPVPVCDRTPFIRDVIVARTGRSCGSIRLPVDIGFLPVRQDITDPPTPSPNIGALRRGDLSGITMQTLSFRNVGVGGSGGNVPLGITSLAPDLFHDTRITNFPSITLTGNHSDPIPANTFRGLTSSRGLHVVRIGSPLVVRRLDDGTNETLPFHVLLEKRTNEEGDFEPFREGELTPFGIATIRVSLREGVIYQDGLTLTLEIPNARVSGADSRIGDRYGFRLRVGQHPKTFTVEDMGNQRSVIRLVGASSGSLASGFRISTSLDDADVSNGIVAIVLMDDQPIFNQLPAPINPSATELFNNANNNTGIELSWDESLPDGHSAITGYRIERAVGDGTFTPLVPNTGNVRTSYTDPAATMRGELYRYRISALNSDGPGVAAPVLHRVTGLRASTAPRNLTVVPQRMAQALLSWEEPANDFGNPVFAYRIERAADEGDFAVINSNTGDNNRQFIDAHLDPASSYRYRVSAINDSGVSEPSAIATLAASATPPGAPQALSVYNRGLENLLRLNWQAPVDDGGSDITGYRIERADGAGGAFSELVENTDSTNTRYDERPGSNDFDPANSYRYRVSAINSAGTGPPSNVVTSLSNSGGICGRTPFIREWLRRAAARRVSGRDILSCSEVTANELDISRASSSGLGHQLHISGFRDYYTALYEAFAPDGRVRLAPGDFADIRVHSIGTETSLGRTQDRRRIRFSALAPDLFSNTQVVSDLSLVVLEGVTMPPNLFRDNAFTLPLDGIRIVDERGRRLPLTLTLERIDDRSTVGEARVRLDIHQGLPSRSVSVQVELTNARISGDHVADEGTRRPYIVIGRNPRNTIVTLTQTDPTEPATLRITDIGREVSPSSRVRNFESSAFISTDPANTPSGVGLYIPLPPPFQFSDSPAPPTQLTADSPFPTTVRLEWQPSTTAPVELRGYRVLRAQGSSGNFTEIASAIDVGITDTYLDETVVAGTQYSYQVIAVHGRNERYVSTPAVATVSTLGSIGVPSRPLTLMAAVMGNNIRLGWLPSITNGNSAITHHVIERAVGDGLFVEIQEESTVTYAYTDSSITADTRYRYRVRAVNTQGEGEFSNVASVIFDNTPPEVREITPLGATNEIRPAYTFSSSEAGVITYAGRCESDLRIAVAGDNTVNLHAPGNQPFTEGTITGCSITVTDDNGNPSNILGISGFVIDTGAPVIALTDSLRAVFGQRFSLSAQLTDRPGATLNYQWSPLNRAVAADNARGSVTLSGTTESITTVLTIPEVVGDLIYRLVVTDDAGNSSNDDVTIRIVRPSNALTINATDDTSTEGGETATVTVVLAARPNAAVMVTLTSSDTGEGRFTSPTPATPEGSVMLTFTPANWNSDQTVTLTGQDDEIDDDNQRYQIMFTTVSTDPRYNDLPIAGANLTNNDDDTRGLNFMPTTLTVVEGDADTYTVALATEPTGGDVTITPSSDNTTAATVSGSLTFTSENWNVAQRVTVFGVDDENRDDESLNINHTASGADYADVTRDFMITTLDNDRSGVTFRPMTLTVDERGMNTYTAELRNQPTGPGNVTVTPSSSDPAIATVSGGPLIFSSGNWNTPQTLTVTAADETDNTNTADETILISHELVGSGNYAAVNAADVTVNIKDNEDPLITVDASTIAVTEGSVALFILTRSDGDDDNLAVTVSVADAGSNLIAGVAPTTATFSGDELTTVLGVNTRHNNIDDGPGAIGNITLTITDGDNYNVGTPGTAMVTVNDDDMAGVTAMATDATTSENRDTAAVTVVLTSEPTADVTVTLTSDNTDEGRFTGPAPPAPDGPVTLTFSSGTGSNWNVPQTVTVTGQDDDVDDDDLTYDITFRIGSADPNYNNRAILPVTLTNEDDDTAGVTAIATDAITSEDGDTGIVTVRLDSQPAVGNVVLDLSSNNPAEGGVAVNTLIFTPANWNSLQTVVVTGVDDMPAAIDGSVGYDIIFMVNDDMTVDPRYDDVADTSVRLINLDDETAIVVLPISVTTTEEAGPDRTANFNVTLNRPPAGDETVMVRVMSRDPTEGRVSPGLLTFTATNYSMAQTVTVTGQNDDVDDDDVPYTITLVTVSSDTGSNLHQNENVVAATNTDDDTAGVTAVATDATSAEGQQPATISVVLTSEPANNVMVTLTSDNTDEGRFTIPVPRVRDGPVTLTFTNGNWNNPQIVTVTGVDDDVDDGNQTYRITFITDSADPAYDNFNIPTVILTNEDDDVSGVTAVATDNTTSEDMDTATVTVRLSSLPAGNVVLDLSSDNTAEGIVAVNTLTFTPADWNRLQTVTVTGVDDAPAELPDGSVEYDLVFRVNTGMTADNLYGALPETRVTLTNLDNETAIVVAPASVMTAEEEGDDKTASFNVTLNQDPAEGETVTISVVSGDPTEGTVSPRSLAFTAANRETPQTVTVTGVDDEIDDDDVPYVINLTAASSDTSSGLHEDINQVMVTNRDNDTRGVTVSVVNLFLARGESRSYTVVLRTQPTAPVTIMPEIMTAPGSMDIATVTPANLVFSTADWGVAQTVTVTGMNNGETIINHNLSSDGDYDGFVVYRVQILVNDTGEVLLDEGPDMTVLGVTLRAEYTDNTMLGDDDAVLSLTSIPTKSDDTVTTGLVVTYAPVSGQSSNVINAPPTATSFGENVTDSDGMVVEVIRSADIRMSINGTNITNMTSDVLVQPVAVCLSADNELQLQAGGIEHLRVYHYRGTDTGWTILPLLESSLSQEADFVCGETRSFAPFGGTAMSFSPFVLGFSTIASRSFAVQSWLARFGRLAASDAVEVLSSRADSLHGRHRSYLKISGKSVSVPQIRNFVRDELIADLIREGAGSGGFDTLRDRFSEYRSLAAMIKQGTSFSYDNEGGVSTVGGWTVWGTGRYGELEGDAQGLAIAGEVISGYVGADYRWSRELLLGIAVSHSEGETDFSQDDNRSEAETNLTSIYPYMHWSPSEGLSGWLTVGYGLGDTEYSDRSGTVDSDIEMWMAAAGFRQELFSVGNSLLTLKGDLLGVRMESDGSELLQSTSSDSRRYRFAMEGSHGWESGFGGRLELGARLDEGDAEDGLGIDVGGELGYGSNYLDIVARGRWLAVHDDDDLEEWGASISMILRPGAAGYGLGFTLIPSWGGRDRSEVENLWHDADRRRTLYRPEPSSDGGMFPDRIEMILTYGVGVGNMLWVPYSEMNLSGSHIEHLRLGSRFDFIGGWLRDRLSMELYGERQTHLGSHDEEYRAGFNSELQF